MMAIIMKLANVPCTATSRLKNSLSLNDYSYLFGMDITSVVGLMGLLDSGSVGGGSKLQLYMRIFVLYYYFLFMLLQEITR